MSGEGLQPIQASVHGTSLLRYIKSHARKSLWCEDKDLEKTVKILWQNDISREFVGAVAELAEGLVSLQPVVLLACRLSVRSPAGIYSYLKKKKRKKKTEKKSLPEGLHGNTAEQRSKRSLL